MATMGMKYELMDELPCFRSRVAVVLGIQNQYGRWLNDMCICTGVWNIIQFECNVFVTVCLPNGLILLHISFCYFTYVYFPTTAHFIWHRNQIGCSDGNATTPSRMHWGISLRCTLKLHCDHLIHHRLYKRYYFPNLKFLSHSNKFVLSLIFLQISKRDTSWYQGKFVDDLLACNHVLAIWKDIVCRGIPDVPPTLIFTQVFNQKCQYNLNHRSGLWCSRVSAVLQKRPIRTCDICDTV